MFTKTAFLTLLLLLSCSVWSSTDAARKRLSDFELHRQMQQNSLFQGIKWQERGPYFCGGRIVDIKAWPDKPYTFLVAAASGGLWKTENNGTTWTPLFDNESSITIGNIAISLRNSDLIWVGTGESNSSRSSYAGTGVFKSMDGGKNWQNMGLTDSQHISRILIDPENDDLVYAAAIGHLYTQNAERGVFKSSDGGKTWKKVLFIDDDTGVIDLVMDPGNSKVLYAAAWQRSRKAWHFTASGSGSGIYKSEDAGQSWKKLGGGFPQNEFVGRIGLAISEQNSKILYAFLDNQEAPAAADPEDGKQKDANQNLFETSIRGGEVYRSEDGGEHWKRTHEKSLDGLVFTYGYYFGEIRVAPDDSNTIYVMGFPLLKSVDGGRTFRDISTQGGIYGVNGVHADMHPLWIDPRNPRRLLLGNDGGLNISYDGGDSWQKVNNLPLAQCYTVNIDCQSPYNVYTGLQDNGVNMGPSTFDRNNPDTRWRMILGGDGAFVAPHPREEGVVFAAFQFGSVFRLDLNRNRQVSIQPKSPDKSQPYRFNWLTPFMVSRHNPSILYLGANKVLMSYNEGKTWMEISPDLSAGKNTDGNVPFATITALDESPLSPEILYAGTDDGRVWNSRKRGGEWVEIGRELPGKWVTRVVASRFKAERVFLSMTGYREDDFETYIFCSEDFGQSWHSLKGNLPGESVNVIREDTEKEDILYLGTDLGVYVSLDRGQHWHSLKGTLPTNAVYDIAVHPREKELIIGTHGRGVFILPLDKIQQLSSDKLKNGLTLFKPAPVKISRSRWQGQSPLEVTFFTPDAGELVVSIQDNSGKKVMQQFVTATRGFNQLEWDLKDTKGMMVKAASYQLVLRSGKQVYRADVLVE